VNLAKQLDNFDMRINVAVMCDAIYRHPWMKWRSLWGDNSILLPDNVRSYYAFFQRKSRPMGVKPRGVANELSWTQLNVIHTEMDDSEAWHSKCVEVVREMAAAFVGGTDSVPADAPESEAIALRKGEL
jgi:hypothetical protein